MKKFYIAGKITGEDYQTVYKKFKITEEILRNANFEVINPVSIVPNGTNWQDAMDILFPHFINCDYILLLPDWKESKGVNLEIKWAKEFKIPVIEFSDLTNFLTNNFNPKFISQCI